VTTARIARASRSASGFDRNRGRGPAASGAAVQRTGTISPPAAIEADTRASFSGVTTASPWPYPACASIGTRLGRGDRATLI
jgi:hypothetical protein